MCLLLAPTQQPGSGPAAEPASSAWWALVNVFTLVFITILRPTVSADLHSFVCPKCFTIQVMPTNLWRWTVTQLFQEHKISCDLPDLSCPHIFFRFKSLSRRSRNDRISASLIPMTLKVFSISSQRADGIRHHYLLKETWQTAGWLSRSRLRDRTCQFRNFTTDSQFYWLRCKTRTTTRVPSKHPILCRPWHCRPDAAYNQSPCGSSSHTDGQGTELSDIFICLDKTVPNTGENAYGRELRNLLCHLEHCQQVADKSWRARPG